MRIDTEVVKNTMSSGLSSWRPHLSIYLSWKRKERGINIQKLKCSRAKTVYVSTELNIWGTQNKSEIQQISKVFSLIFVHIRTKMKETKQRQMSEK